MMIASHTRIPQLALAKHRSTKFGRKDYQRIFQHAEPFQIVDKCRGRLINITTLVR